METKNCPDCGTELDKDALKCHYCGNDDPDGEATPNESDFGIDPEDY